MPPRLKLILGLLLAGLAAAAPAAGAEPARAVLNIDYNLDTAGPSPASLNSLDLYLPARTDDPGGLRPVVIWVHGGGFIRGDKANRMADKVRLFNGLGYLVASVNYRLSPDISENCCSFDPSRVRAPDHISDLAEAIGWMARNIQGYGGDPDAMLLVGHSAGAQMVSLAGTSPVWFKDRQVSPRQILGVVSLDTDTFDVRSEAADSSPLQARMLAWNAFGTPGEELADPRWDQMSPILHADPSDPDFLFVTQSARPLRLAANQAVAGALGQDPAATVLGVPLDHEGINTMLGSPADPTAESARVGEFVRGVVAEARPAGVRITRRPARKVVVKVRRGSGKKALRRSRGKVTFAFRGVGRAAGFQCRVDRRAFSRCRSPVSYRLNRGSHSFKVRPLYPSGRPGVAKTVKFRIVIRHPARGRLPGSAK